MIYRNFKKFDGLGINGKMKFNIGTIFVSNEDGIIVHNNSGTMENDILCYDHSEVCYQYLVPEFDDEWLQRGLTRDSIWELLKNIKSQEEKNKIFEILFNDSISNKYRQIKDDIDKERFIWNRYKLLYANLFDLTHILAIIKQNLNKEEM